VSFDWLFRLDRHGRGVAGEAERQAAQRDCQAAFDALLRLPDACRLEVLEQFCRYCGTDGTCDCLSAYTCPTCGGPT